MDVSPDKQNIDGVFSNKTYHIDFYQRDYRWTEEPVVRLLDDIFFKFNEVYKLSDGVEATPELVESKYPWYYLNTYVTNTVDGKVFVVDGQQRLTTLTLISIKLLHLAKDCDSKLAKWIDTKIAGQSGFDHTFWMNHEGHVDALQALYDNDLDNVDVSSGITAVNMEKNFHVIGRWLDENLTTKNKIETFVLYFFRRLVLINLSVEQTDVPMVFEVINDRGVRLKPFEIIKGKLLGQIDKEVLRLQGYNELWESRVQSINDYYDDEFDGFFRFWLKARFADTRKEGQRFDGDYHRVVFSNDFQKNLSLSHNQSGVIEFLDGPFKYYTDLYEKLLRKYASYEVSPIIYSKVNDIDGAYLLLLSSCKINDPEAEEKMKRIPLEVDRIFSLLQLQGSYDSNSFQEALFKISKEIRDRQVCEVRKVFDRYLMNEVSRKKSTSIDEPFQYTYFKNIGIGLNARFKRYFFARVEEFLSNNMNLNMKHNFQDLVTKTGSRSGFHIEHILARNEENMEIFNDDAELFEQERNRLGAILLLKGKDNISSGKEFYKDKLKTYANTLYWNETLRQDSYKSKIDLNDLRVRFKLDLEPIDNFGPEHIEKRQKVLFEISSLIWR